MKTNGPTEKSRIPLDEQSRRYQSLKAVIDQYPGVTPCREGGNVRMASPSAAADPADGRRAEAADRCAPAGEEKGLTQRARGATNSCQCAAG